ncbi:MAG: PAS domain S-box protein [Tardiphaga sp.]
MTDFDQGLLGAALNALDAGIAILDSSQRVVGWNDWLVSASGVASVDATGKTLLEVFGVTLSNRLMTAIADALTLNSSGFLTHSLNPNLFPFRTRAGLPMLQNVTIRSLGSFPDAHCLIQVVDVTGAAHREKILRERQNARYDAVVESAPDAILTLDAEGVVRFANPSAEREIGYAPSELIGKRLGILFDDTTEWDQLLLRVLEGESSVRPIELQARRKDGSETHLEISASRWPSAGRFLVTAILRDVSERYAAQLALQALNLTLEKRVAERTQERDQVWQVSQDMLGVADANGVWISVNPAWERTLGWLPDDIRGRTLEWLQDPAESASSLEKFVTLAMTAQTFHFENILRTRAGDYRVLSWTAVHADGLIYCVARDITEQRRQQDALLAAEEALRQSQKMEAVGQLTGGLAHDFNNLLTGISGSLELLQLRISQGRHKDVERYISTAQGAANRAAALTHRLLAFSRRQTLDPKATDINRLIAGMRDLIDNTVGPAIETKVSESGDLWTTLVDPNQLENALLNLCINARDAMPDGGTLTIATVNHSFDASDAQIREMRSGDYVGLSVTDTGTGMSEGVIQRAFDPFYTTKPLGQGTGLGLSMIYGFAKQSGGQVRIVSKLGSGTTVEIFLPRHNQQETALDLAADISSSPRARAGETVLIVDDEPSVRMLITEVLAELGYTSIEASEGSSALRVLQSDVRIDLLVTDVGLPGGMNGRQLADFGRIARPTLKILFITGYAEKSVLGGEQIEDGMGILTKPFAMEGLATRIKELISIKGAV